MAGRLALASSVLLLLAPSLAGATSFTVQPIIVVLTEPTSSALLAVTNQSDATLRLQVRQVAWTQDATGQMILDPTTDIVVFPKLLTLRPKEQRHLRVGTTQSHVGIERAYRLYVRELPPPPVAAPFSESRLNILTEVGIPVFVRHGRPSPQAVLQDVGVQAGKLAFRVRNTGDAHVMLQKVQITGKGEAASAIDQEINGWYVLAAGERRFEVPIAQAACRGLSEVHIAAFIDDGTLRARVRIDPQTCGDVPTP